MNLLSTLLCTALIANATPLPGTESTAPPVQPAVQTDATTPAAYVNQARQAWDGGEAPDAAQAKHLLELALEGYRTQAVAHPEDTELAAYITHLETVYRLMGRFEGFDASASVPQDKDLQGFFPSFLALELFALPDTDAQGLRLRLTCVQAQLESDRGRHLLSRLAAPLLHHMDIRTSELDSPDYLGLTSWFSDATSFGAIMDFFMANMPAAGSGDEDAAARLAKDLRRALIVNDTLAHELSHVYFCSRYPKISSGTADDIRMVYEGHAISTAYTFVRDVYFRGKLTPEQYASLMLSPRYTRYFQWFRGNILSGGGDVRWDMLDALELRNAPASYYVRTRSPHKSSAPKARPYRYFGKRG